MGSVNEGREGIQWSEQEFCRNRFYNYLGNAHPSTISVKELGGDNAIDQISDGKTNIGYIEIGKDFKSVTVLDGGKGISLRQTIRKDNGKPSTFLFLNIAKLYTSTNYQEDDKAKIEDASSTIGQNGIGSKVSNFCSSHFTAGIVARHPGKHVKNVVKNTVPGETFDKEVHDLIYGTEENPATGCVKGYHFQRGIAKISEDHVMTEENPEWIAVNVPLFFGEKETYGYFVHAEYDTEILGDEIDCSWIEDYIKTRISNCTVKNKDIFFTYRYPVKDADSNVTIKEKIFTKPVNATEFKKTYKKDIEDGKIEVLLSWEEMCEEVKAANPGDVWGPFDFGFYKIFYAKTADLIDKIPNMAQGAKVFNPKQFTKVFPVANTTIRYAIPCCFKLTAKNARGLAYSDQTKERLVSNQKTPAKLHINCLEKQFDKISDMKEYFQRLANEKYLTGTGKKIRSDFYFPASGGKTAREFFSKHVDKEENLKFILDSIKDDPDVIAYVKENNIDLDSLVKA